MACPYSRLPGVSVIITAWTSFGQSDCRIEPKEVELGLKSNVPEFVISPEHHVTCVSTLGSSVFGLL
ncbi:hypothetical protein AOLI_G00100390 [Acnodon oligacanthus]